MTNDCGMQHHGTENNENVVHDCGIQDHDTISVGLGQEIMLGIQEGAEEVDYQGGK